MRAGLNLENPGQHRCQPNKFKFFRRRLSSLRLEKRTAAQKRSPAKPKRNDLAGGF